MGGGVAGTGEQCQRLVSVLVAGLKLGAGVNPRTAMLVGLARDFVSLQAGARQHFVHVGPETASTATTDENWFCDN